MQAVSMSFRAGLCRDRVWRRLLCSWMTWWACLPAAATAADRPPNIVVIVADDLGWKDVGYHGSEIRTPHIDKLAMAGVRLERHYVYPTCSPTRAGLLTGRNPSRFGIHGPIAGRSEQSLPSGTPTVASVLRTRGYTTALLGKWHLGLRPEVGPRQYGFDQTYGYLHGQIDQYAHLYKNGDRSWHRNDSFVDETGHATDLIAGEAVRFITTQRSEPFFLWVAFSVPHFPLQEEDQWVAAYSSSIKDPSRRVYAASVAHMDAAIGRITAALEKAGKLSETVIFFTSDNGGQEEYHSEVDYRGKHGPYPVLGNNRPFRGWKQDLYEGGVRVPAFVYWVDHIKPRVIQAPISYLDWCPTLAHLVGARVSDQWKLEGRNVWSLVSGRGEEPPSPTLYWNVGDSAAVLQENWKLIVRQQDPNAVELYDLARDAAEKTNRAAENSGKVEQLREVLAAQRNLDP